MPNNTKYFYPADGNWKLTTLPMKVSTAMTEGAAISIEISSNDVTGYHTLSGVENAAGNDFAGILAEPIASTDSDYATAGKLKAVYVPRNQAAKAFFTVGAGTFTTADIGKTVEITAGALGLSVGTAGEGARITDYISATRGKCQFVLPNTETA